MNNRFYLKKHNIYIYIYIYVRPIKICLRNSVLNSKGCPATVGLKAGP